MDQNILNTNIKKITRQRNGFFIFSIVLSFSVLLLSVFLFAKKERIIVVPTNGDSYWIEEGAASSTYIEKMGIFLSDLLLTRSPVDIEKRNSIVLQYVHPSAYHEIRKLLLKEQENIIKGDQSFYFHSEKNYIDPTRMAFVTEGEFFVLIGKDGKEPSVTQKTRKKYTLGFSCENGRLLLTSLKKEEV